MLTTIHFVPFDPSLPVSQCTYIPQFQFDHIAMQHPAILSTLDSHCMNPLYGYTSWENIQAWYIDFQNMGQQAVQWICAVCAQSIYLGPYSGWNWDALYCDVPGVDFLTDILLHPSLLAYAKQYPNHNVFSKKPLINNGYVKHEGGDLTPYASVLAPINSNVFTILSLPEIHAD